MVCLLTSICDLFGAKPKRPTKGKIADQDTGFTVLDKIIPHPIYAWTGWACVNNHRQGTLSRFLKLTDCSYEKAILRKFRIAGCLITRFMWFYTVYTYIHPEFTRGYYGDQTVTYYGYVFYKKSGQSNKMYFKVNDNWTISARYVDTTHIGKLGHTLF